MSARWSLKLKPEGRNPPLRRRNATASFLYWKDGDDWIGYLEDYPDYWTQGKTVEEMQKQLRDLYRDLADGSRFGIRRRGHLVLRCNVHICSTRLKRWAVSSCVTVADMFGIATPPPGSRSPSPAIVKSMKTWRGAS